MKKQLSILTLFIILLPISTYASYSKAYFNMFNQSNVKVWVKCDGFFLHRSDIESCSPNRIKPVNFYIGEDDLVSNITGHDVNCEVALFNQPYERIPDRCEHFQFPLKHFDDANSIVNFHVTKDRSVWVEGDIGDVTHGGPCSLNTPTPSL